MSYDPTPESVLATVAQLTERVAILEDQLREVRLCMRERMAASQAQHEACAAIKVGGTD